MIRIDHIAFDFTAPDEAFARGLYADWDGFCRRCFERVAEECLAPYGADKALHELERLDLDLGSIPEEDLYSEFPRRLREALLDALPPLHTLQIQASPEKTAASLMNSLLFYLEQGHPLPEWADEGFNPQEETTWLTGRSADSYHTFIRRAAILCLKREHALRRLLHRTDNYTIFLDLYAAALTEPSAGQAEKRRLLVLLLEERPDVPVRYVHGARGDGELRGMADLLDSLSVRHIIRTETKEHAEVDLPPYWHYLYEWLVKYYPYNGIAMFGGKSDFIRHLHFRLLTFIRGRSGAPYLSKEELTVGFLLEVFGAAYYKDVLNAIYRLQPHTPDGSPVYDGYLNMELYRTFLRLSLLRLPKAAKEDFAAYEDRQNDMALPFSAEAFTAWLKDTSVPLAIKRELMREAATEKLSEWLSLLRALPEGSKALASLGTMLTAHDLLASIAQANFHQASVLSRVIERLRHPVVSLSVPLTDSGIPLETFLRKALLAYLQDPEASGRTLSEREITDKFLSYLRLATIGKEQAETDTVQWQRLAEAMADSPSENTGSLPKEKLLQALSAPFASHIALRQALVRLMDRQPDGLLIWLEQNTDTNKIYRLAEISDGLMTSHWANRLAATPGFAHPDAFRQLTAWLLRRRPATELTAALFLYVKEPGWRTFTPEQMEAYFFSRLYGKTHAPSIEETLADESLPKAIRQRLFRHNLRYRPEQLLAFIREAVRQNSLPLNRWMEWTDTSDWLQLAAGLSLAKAELLRQITDSLSLPEEERKKVLATYIIYGDTEEWPYDTPRETVRSFVETLPSMQGEDTDVLTATVRKVERELDIPEERPEAEETPEVLPVGNAGLCLLAPWFIRLFSMLGYLDEERKKFRNTASKVRAVFLLQYLVCGEERDWREPELAFNCLLTALPGHVPLPRRLALTGEERQTADGMMAGVKANWPQMNGTSVQGFRGSFIARNGLMEQEEERWLLTVEEKAYDVLLDTVPWGFRQIRLPWLKKYVQVRWQEKQTF